MTGFRFDTGGFRLLAALYMLLLGLALVLVPAGPISPPSTWDTFRGILSILGALALLWAGVLRLPRGWHLAFHAFASLSQWFGVYTFVRDGHPVPGALVLGTLALAILILAFDRPAPGGRAPDPAPSLAVVTFTAILAFWPLTSLAMPGNQVETFRSFGIEVRPFWIAAAIMAPIACVLEFVRVPRPVRTTVLLAAVVPALVFTALLPIRVAAVYWLMNTATFVRTGGILVAHWTRGRRLLESAELGERLFVALITFCILPLTAAAASVVLIDDPGLFTVTNRQVLFGIAILSLGVAVFGSLLVSRALTQSLSRMSALVRRIPLGERGPFAAPSAPTELRLIAAELEHTLAVLDLRAEERDQLITRLAEAERAKAQILSQVTHDLRNPLTVLLGYAQLLDRRAHAQPLQPAEAAETTQAILHHARRMERMLDELFDPANVTAGQRMSLAYQPFDLAALVLDVARDQANVAGRTVDVQAVAATLRGVWDPTRIERVIVNLIQNALKYSQAPEPVELTLDADPAGQAVILRVRDHGIGIPDRDRDTIFEPWKRGSNTGGTVGSGLGLASVREIVSAHGGAVTVESRAGQGSVFTVRLPLSPPQDLLD